MSNPTGDALSAIPQPEPVAWQWRTRIKGGAWDAWENGRYRQQCPPFREVDERALYASPPSYEALRDENYCQTAYKIAKLEEALKRISEQDDTELMLDPTWAKRIARAALGQEVSQ